MADILSINEVRKALYLDYDYDEEELLRLNQAASSFIKQKCKYDFAAEEPKEPLAVQCAVLYVRSQFYQGASYNPEYDYTLGLNSLVIDLQNIARVKIAASA